LGDVYKFMHAHAVEVNGRPPQNRMSKRNRHGTASDRDTAQHFSEDTSMEFPNAFTALPASAGAKAQQAQKSADE
jgi:hypothetical protein